MEPLKLDQPRPPESHWQFDEPYKFIAGWMKSKGLMELGDQKCREKLKRKDGELRPWGLGMDKLERALRTLTIKKLSEQGLVKIHEYEQKKMLRFLSFDEIKKISGCPIKSSGPIDERQLSEIDEFNVQNRPKPRKVQGVSVPAYFLLDEEFDGMNYHHQWDWACWHNHFELPVRVASRRTISKQLVGSYE